MNKKILLLSILILIILFTGCVEAGRMGNGITIDDLNATNSDVTIIGYCIFAVVILMLIKSFIDEISKIIWISALIIIAILLLNTLLT